MHGRFEAVEDAHCKTFEWIFEPDSKKDNQNGCSGPESFKHWLSSGRGIFHISGKLGSGKSTLMKFLCEHKRTKNELQKWSGMLWLKGVSFLITLRLLGQFVLTNNLMSACSSP
jgi:hypothetical protein